MREYMEDEHLEKKKAEYDLSEWTDVFNEVSIHLPLRS